MEQVIDQNHAHLAEGEAFQSNDPTEIENFRIKFLGKKGSLTALFAAFKEVPNDQKKAFGQQLNALKIALMEAKSQQEGLKVEQEKIDFDFSINFGTISYTQNDTEIAFLANDHFADIKSEIDIKQERDIKQEIKTVTRYTISSFSRSFFWVSSIW